MCGWVWCDEWGRWGATDALIHTFWSSAILSWGIIVTVLQNLRIFLGDVAPMWGDGWKVAVSGYRLD